MNKGINITLTVSEWEDNKPYANSFICYWQLGGKNVCWAGFIDDSHGVIHWEIRHPITERIIMSGEMSGNDANAFESAKLAATQNLARWSMGISP